MTESCPHWEIETNINSLGIRSNDMDDKTEVGLFFLRMGLAFVFIWSAFGKLVLGMRPPLDSVIPFIHIDILIVMLSIVELTVGLLYFFGLVTRINGALSALLMLLIITTGILLGMFSEAMLAKDIAILSGCLCLALSGSQWMSLDGGAGIR